MQYRQLGSSDIKISAITLGAWAIGGTMWGGTDERKSVEAIRRSIELGVTTIDTAPIYGFGRSEEIVGRAVAGQRDKVQILTKYCMAWDSGVGEHFFDLDEGGKRYKIYLNARKQSVIRECEASLRRLKTDYIDLYQCHWRDHTTPVEETMEAVAQLLKEGKIRAAGVSNFTVDDIRAASSLVPIASDQPPYSMVLRDIEKDVLPYCREHNIGVIVYSPLQRGLLTGKFKPDHKFPPGDHRATQVHFQPENIRRVNAFLEKIKPIAEAHKATLGQLVLSWTINQPGITAAIVGARDAAQAEENARAASVDLSSAELETITDLVDTLKSEEVAAS